MSNIDQLLDLAKSGDRRSLSRLLTEIEHSQDTSKTPLRVGSGLWA
ncbi:MAG: hypothetical protein ACJZ4Q_02850 [Candidatus Thalassarchaeaceae archaeon]